MFLTLMSIKKNIKSSSNPLSQFYNKFMIYDTCGSNIWISK